MKQATICLYLACSAPQGLVIFIFLAHLKYTACLNWVVLISESGLDRDNFESIISPKWERAACDLVGKKCKLSTPRVPVESWSILRWKSWLKVSFLPWASRSYRQFCCQWYLSTLCQFLVLSQSGGRRRILQRHNGWMTFYSCGESNQARLCCPWHKAILDANCHWFFVWQTRWMMRSSSV